MIGVEDINLDDARETYREVARLLGIERLRRAPQDVSAGASMVQDEPNDWRPTLSLEELTQALADPISGMIVVPQPERSSTETVSFELLIESHFAAQNTGDPFARFVPAYEFGRDLGNDPAYADDWAALAKTLRSKWEARNPNTWEEFSESVRFAFELVRRTRGRVIV